MTTKTIRIVISGPGHHSKKRSKKKSSSKRKGRKGHRTAKQKAATRKLIAWNKRH